MRFDEWNEEWPQDMPCCPMSQEEFDVLSELHKAILTCNVIGCEKMVSTCGLLCIEHQEANGKDEG